MNTSIGPEHFCTVFDHRFLPMGMAMAESLREHCPHARLWVICLDETVEKQLDRLELPAVHTIRLAELETPELLAVKPQRTAAEYCWTLTPFLFDAVLAREPAAGRVTYVDTDLFFWDRPEILLEELDRCGKQVLITEHAFAPQYAHGADHGRFCVQFLTFRRSAEADRVRASWQRQCLEWCYDRLEDGRFGDQKYLDDWPDRFGSAVHVLEQTDRTLGPWNVSHVAEHTRNLRPVFFHFHGLRFISDRRVRRYFGYRINAKGAKLYDAYLRHLSRCVDRMHRAGIAAPVFGQAGGFRWRLRGLWYRMRGRLSHARLPVVGPGSDRD